MPPAIYFEASFGGIPLRIGNISTERGRDIAVQSPAYGDKHTLTDRGLRQRSTSCELLFVDVPGQNSYTDRYEAFVRLAESNEPALFSHPIDGQYRARCSNVDAEASADELSIRVSCTFLREDAPQVVFPVAAGVSTSAGPEAVSVAAGLVDEQLAAVGLASTVSAEAFAIVDAWHEAGEELDAQRVYLEVATLTELIDTMIADYELAQDLTRYQAYEAVIRLRYQIVRVAEMFTSATATVFDLHVEVAQPVLRICSEVYGAALAVELAEQVTHLNRLRTPSLVPRGTTLKMPAVGG